MKRKKEEQELFDLITTWTPDEIRDFGKRMAACIRSAENSEQARLIHLLRTMTAAELREFKIRLFGLIHSVITARRSAAQSHSRDEAIAELYAVKSFQAQNMSGRFNRARMNQAIKEAKPKGVSHG